MLIPVKGNKGLFRDKNTSAILNCSDSDYQQYLEVKNTKIKEVVQMNEMTEKINEMMKLIISKLDTNS